MKNLLVILLLTFAVIAGFSGAVSAAYVSPYGHVNKVNAPITNSLGANANINSPGATIFNAPAVSKTGGDSFNAIGSNVRKSTTNIGTNIKTVGNKVY